MSRKLKPAMLLLAALIYVAVGFAQPTEVSYPVSVASLQAGVKNQTAVLEWKTVCYLSYANFKIERSTDGINFTEIHGFSANRLRCQQPFQFEDNDLPAQSKIFYRVNAGDLDGNFFHSKIAAIFNSSTANSIKLFPTITSSVFNLVYNATASEKLTILLIGNNGRIMQSARVNAVAGNNQFSFNVSLLGSGVYFVSVSGGRKPFTGTLIKQ